MNCTRMRSLCIGMTALAISASAALGQGTISSPDGTWVATVDAAGQVENLFTPAQPTSDNIFETLLYVADTTSGQLSRRVETAFIVTDQQFTPNGSFTRLEDVAAGLSIEIENIMRDGANGGCLVKVKCENKGIKPIGCKLFYYVDFDISGDFADDEAMPLFNPPPCPADLTGNSVVNAADLAQLLGAWGPVPGCPPLFIPEDLNNDCAVNAADLATLLGAWGPCPTDGPIRAIQQGDDGETTIKPLMVGGCKPYKSWSIQTFSTLRAALDGGVPQLDGMDSTAPGAADHTAALSTGKVLLEPGNSDTVRFGLGTPAFDSCEPPPIGACCLPREDTGCGVVQPDPACVLTSAGACQAAGGTYLGDGVPCEQTIPTLNHISKQLVHRVVTASQCGGAGPGCVDGPYKVDAWTTANGTVMDKSGNPIPADFFGPGSDPFDGQVQLRGEPLGEVQLPGFPDPLDFGDADTLVRRSLDPFGENDSPGGPPVQVAIELVELSLVSCDPITVTFNGGQNPEEWDVAVDLSVLVAPPGGTLTAIKTHCNGGTYTSTLDVCPRFIFTNVANPGIVFEFDLCSDLGQSIQLVLIENGPWVHDLKNVGPPSPVCSVFNPGVDDVIPDNDCE